MPNFTFQQEAAISAVSSGKSIAIRAVAGSGKTTTLVAALQTAPSNSLSVAFNKKNAEDLASKMPSSITSKTLNALGHAAWAKHIGKRLIVDTKKTFTLAKSYGKDLSKEDFSSLLQLIRLAKAKGISSGFGGTAAPNMSEWKLLAEAHDILDCEGLFTLAEAILLESCKLAFQGNIDFDDQLYMPVLFNSNFQKYSLLAVDEAQDLSPLQHTMVERSLAPSAQLVVVGDPNQAIYGFRGASTSSFSDFTEKFNLPILPLTASFRCPISIVKEAKKYVPDIEAAGTFQGKVNQSYSAIMPRQEIAVLSRTNAPLLSMAFSALRKSVPVNYLGRDFMSGLKTLSKKYPSKGELEFWYNSQMKTLKGEASKARCEDRYSCLLMLYEEGPAVLEQLLSSPKEKSMILSTIHKAKGLEWDHVVYLDYGKDWKGNQEDNIKYVGVTRSKNTLTLQEK